MTWRQLYEFALIEVNKLNAPSLLLEDYNYFINKAVQQYMNMVYNRYDINQQSNDDLRALTTSRKYTNVQNNSVKLPMDYVHLLNCIVTIDADVNNRDCVKSQVKKEMAAKRLTSDRYAGILNNYYLKPSARRPYYMLKSADSRLEIPLTTDGDRVSNASNIYDSILEIKCGSGNNVSEITIDYVRAPQEIKLTDADIYSITDTTQDLEFPDYVCFEIVNIFTKLLMENAGDPRLQTNFAVNQTISNGATT